MQGKSNFIENLNFTLQEYLSLKCRRMFCCLHNPKLLQRIHLYNRGIKIFSKNFDIIKIIKNMRKVKALKKLTVNESNKQMFKDLKLKII